MNECTIAERDKASRETVMFTNSKSFSYSLLHLYLQSAGKDYEKIFNIMDEMLWFFIYVNRYKSFCSETPLPENIAAAIGELVVDAPMGMIYYLLDVNYMDDTFPIRIAVKFWGAAGDMRGGWRDVTIVMHELVPSDEQHPMNVFYKNIVGYYHPGRTEQETYDFLCQTVLHVMDMQKRNKKNRRRNRGKRR